MAEVYRISVHSSVTFSSELSCICIVLGYLSRGDSKDSSPPKGNPALDQFIAGFRGQLYMLTVSSLVVHISACMVGNIL